MFWQRRLPHGTPDGSILLVTWRLADTMPQTPPEILKRESDPGRAFVREDPALGRAKSGPRWLKDPRIAAMCVEALRHGEMERKIYELFAWVLMPHHVHLVLRPTEPLHEILRWLKSAAGNRANQILGNSGQRFWQREYYDHWIRSETELWKVNRYVEHNPVTAGLATSQERWPWSRAGNCAAGKDRRRYE